MMAAYLFKGAREPCEGFLREVGEERDASEELDQVLLLLDAGLRNDVLEHGALQGPELRLGHG